MKKIHFALVSLTLMFIVSSLTIQQKESARTFDKIVWLEVNVENDSVLIKPYSKAWGEMWHRRDQDMFIDGSAAMNYEKYKFAFNNRKDNLFTLLHPQIIDGSLQIYSPYDPQTYGLGNRDDGEMRFPVNGKNPNETFLTSDSIRSNYAYYLGKFGPQSDMTMIDEYGDPMVKTMADGTLEYVYPPRDYMWYKDSDIVKYKLRVRISYTKKGIEKKRTIESIAPVVNQYYEDQIDGEMELFWLDFNDITPILKEAFYFDVNGKPVSYLNHLQQKVLTASF